MTGIALRDAGLSLADVITLARAADDAGLASLWLPEVGSRDALVLAALVGASTRRATVGTGVVPIWSRSVVGLALAAASAAEACGGRFVLGLGTGHRAAAEAWYGGTWQRPRTRLRETIELLRRLLAGERVTHHGELRVSGFQLGSRPPPVAIYVGALTPATLRLAGQVADGVILNWMPPEAMGRCALLAREAAADAGRSLRVLGYVRAAVIPDSGDPGPARSALRDQTYAYASLPTYAASLRHAGLGGLQERMAVGDEGALDALTEALCLCGTPPEVRAGAARYREAGLDEVVVYPVAYGDDPAASVLRTLRALAP